MMMVMMMMTLPFDDGNPDSEDDIDIAGGNSGAKHNNSQLAASMTTLGEKITP